jgi:hypothetical protein
MTRFWKALVGFFRARCPECGNRLGSTKRCQSCDEHKAAMQGIASDARVSKTLVLPRFSLVCDYCL